MSEDEKNLSVFDDKLKLGPPISRHSSEGTNALSRANSYGSSTYEYEYEDSFVEQVEEAFCLPCNRADKGKINYNEPYSISAESVIEYASRDVKELSELLYMPFPVVNMIFYNMGFDKQKVIREVFEAPDGGEAMLNGLKVSKTVSSYSIEPKPPQGCAICKRGAPEQAAPTEVRALDYSLLPSLELSKSSAFKELLKRRAEPVQRYLALWEDCKEKGAIPKAPAPETGKSSVTTSSVGGTAAAAAAREDNAASELDFVSMGCGHAFCRNCYVDYCCAKIYGNDVFNIQCMDPDCHIMPSKETLSAILGDSTGKKGKASGGGGEEEVHLPMPAMKPQLPL